MKSTHKRCRYCKEKFANETMKKVNLTWFCSYDHAAKFGVEKSNKSIALVEAKKHRAAKASLKLDNTRHQHKLTQKVFNRLRVLQELEWFNNTGIEPYCISCGKTNMDWCCGHFKTVGSSGALRYDVKNTTLQCNFYCNMNKSGNIEGCSKTHGYKKGLLLRFGEIEGQRIIDYCMEGQSTIKKWTGLELQQMRKEFSAEIKRLESIP